MDSLPFGRILFLISSCFSFEDALAENDFRVKPFNCPSAGSRDLQIASKNYPVHGKEVFQVVKLEGFIGYRDWI